MDDKQFERLASDELERIEEALSALDGVDVDLADGILTLEADLGRGKPRGRALLPGREDGSLVRLEDGGGPVGPPRRNRHGTAGAPG